MTRTYKGKPIEKGATSIKGQGAAPAIRWLVEKGLIKPGMKVLDYGAGKYARNADYLRKLGCKVYAYDPFNYNTTGSGYTMGAVTKRKPHGKFDVAFSCFVLNVVPVKVEREIVREVETYADTTFHIHRNQDILKVAADTIDGIKNNKHIKEWYSRFIEGYPYGTLVGAFCRHGFQTSKNKFQRLPKDTSMRRRGYRKIVNQKSHIVWADKTTAETLSK